MQVFVIGIRPPTVPRPQSLGRNQNGAKHGAEERRNQQQHYDRLERAEDDIAKRRPRHGRLDHADDNWLLQQDHYQQFTRYLRPPVPVPGPR